jgi:hypothetical protein
MELERTDLPQGFQMPQFCCRWGNSKLVPVPGVEERMWRQSTGYASKRWIDTATECEDMKSDLSMTSHSMS